MSKCACIVLNYNDSATTVKLLKRIYSFSVFSLILVVDNCSTFYRNMQTKQTKK